MPGVLQDQNEFRWRNAKMTRSQSLFDGVAKRLVAAKDRYKAVEARTGVPWYVIAVIHEREASQKWTSSIAQGDPWNKVSIHVPKGRGPFKSWEDAAVDALMNCPPYAAKNRDWSAGVTLSILEKYNGLGYYNKELPSPYIWAGTDQYVKGKYIADGKFDANAVDTQLGCAGVLRSMMKLDASVALSDVTKAIDEVPTPQSPPPPVSIPSTPVLTPQPGFWERFARLLIRGGK